MNSEYDDIIGLPHYTPKRHPRMPMMARAAQFAPFSALTGYSNEIKKTEKRVLDNYERFGNDDSYSDIFSDEEF